MKNLFKLAAIAVVLLASCPLFAQTEEAAQEPEPYKVYCMITGNRLAFSEKMNVSLDFGQFASWWSTDRSIADESGKAIVFNSMLDAANFMARRGWELEEVFLETRISNGTSYDPTYHWVMSKMVTCDEEVTEGIQTVGMNKKR